MTLQRVECWRCGRLIAEQEGALSDGLVILRCFRCGARTQLGAQASRPSSATSRPAPPS